MEKELFIKTMGRIETHIEELDRFEDALSLFTDGHSVCTIGEWILDSLVEFIAKDMNCSKDLLFSYLFEGPVEGNYEDGTEFYIDDLEDLYEFLTEGIDENSI
jgi:hypothetical protein